MPATSSTPHSAAPPGQQAPYTGRFAPSPTGPLHFGSLVSALASYLHARAADGQWLVRMEDLDPPREAHGAADQILSALEAHRLEWDGPVLYQSQRLDAYQAILDTLRDRSLAYRCRCSRKDIQAMGGVYDGRCRHRAIAAEEPHAWRLKLYDVPDGVPEPAEPFLWSDIFQGRQRTDLRREVGDLIIRRKDNLFAYQLAVVVDDIAQGVTHVIRGIDLLPVSAGQAASFALLGARHPVYGHVPIAVNAEGQKLSKQNQAPALNPQQAGANLWQALRFLGQTPPSELLKAPANQVLDWARHHWLSDRVRGRSAPAPEVSRA